MNNKESESNSYSATLMVDAMNLSGNVEGMIAMK